MVSEERGGGAGNPFEQDLPSYRWVLIQDLRALTALNGAPITHAERATAFRKAPSPCLTCLCSRLLSVNVCFSVSNRVLLCQ